jgi:hypothetical protein
MFNFSLQIENPLSPLLCQERNEWGFFEHQPLEKGSEVVVREETLSLAHSNFELQKVIQKGGRSIGNGPVLCQETIRS